jgi:hypothetical protein
MLIGLLARSRLAMLLKMRVDCFADSTRSQSRVVSEMVCEAFSVAFLHAQRNLGRTQPDDVYLFQILTIHHEFPVVFAVRFKMGIDLGEIRRNGSMPVARLNSKEESSHRRVEALNAVRVRNQRTACENANRDQQYQQTTEILH